VNANYVDNEEYRSRQSQHNNENDSEAYKTFEVKVMRPLPYKVDAALRIPIRRESKAERSETTA
jgi:hypothetical protein